MKLEKPNAFLFYKTCIFELKLNVLFAVIKKLPYSLPFLQKQFYIKSVQKNQLISNSDKLSFTTFY